MQVFERIIGCLELFLYDLEDKKRRRLYGYVAGHRDRSYSIIYGTGSDSSVGQIKAKSLMNSPTQNDDSPNVMHTSKTQRFALKYPSQV